MQQPGTTKTNMTKLKKYQKLKKGCKKIHFRYFLIQKFKVFHHNVADGARINAFTAITATHCICKKKLLQTAPNCFKKTAPKDFLYLPSPYKTLKRLPQKTKVSKPK